MLLTIRDVLYLLNECDEISDESVARIVGKHQLEIANV